MAYYQELLLIRPWWTISRDYSWAIKSIKETRHAVFSHNMNHGWVRKWTIENCKSLIRPYTGGLVSVDRILAHFIRESLVGALSSVSLGWSSLQMACFNRIYEIYVPQDRWNSLLSYYNNNFFIIYYYSVCRLSSPFINKIPIIFAKTFYLKGAIILSGLMVECSILWWKTPERYKN